MTHHFTYRVTFEGTRFYYYGVHSTKNINDGYLGSPLTNRWCWELYDATLTPLEFFETREEAGEMERRLILPFLNETLCLNERCGKVSSLETSRRAGKVSGEKHKRLGTGVCGVSREEKAKQARKGHKTSRVNKTGWNNSEVQRELGKKGAAVAHAQRWKNTDPRFEPYTSNAGGLSHWQRKRGIDTSLRVRAS
jgi:hypothetical protein